MIKSIQISWWDSSESDTTDYKVGELDKAIKDFVTTQKEETQKILENGINGSLTSGMELLVNGKVIMKAILDVNPNNLEDCYKLKDLKHLLDKSQIQFIKDKGFEDLYDKPLNRKNNSDRKIFETSRENYDNNIYITYYEDEDRIHIDATENEKHGYFPIQFLGDEYQNGGFEYE